METDDLDKALEVRMAVAEARIDAITQMMAQLNATVSVISHDMTTIKRLMAVAMWLIPIIVGVITKL